LGPLIRSLEGITAHPALPWDDNPLAHEIIDHICDEEGKDIDLMARYMKNEVKKPLGARMNMPRIASWGLARDDGNVKFHTEVTTEAKPISPEAIDKSLALLQNHARNDSFT